MELGSLLVGAAVPNMTFNFIDNTGVLDTGAIQFGSGSGFIVGSAAAQTITGVTEGDKFVIVGANFNGDTVDYSGTTLTVMNGGQLPFSL